jgi:hypothetical protein
MPDWVHGVVGTFSNSPIFFLAASQFQLHLEPRVDVDMAYFYGLAVTTAMAVKDSD